MLATAGKDGTVKIWDLLSAPAKMSYMTAYSSMVANAVCLYPQEAAVEYGGPSKTVIDDPDTVYSIEFVSESLLGMPSKSSLNVKII